MIKVVIVEDNEPIRKGLTELINHSNDFECSGSFSSSEEALINIPKINPDIILMDIQLPGISGIECVRIIKKEYPFILIMMLTVFENNDNIFESLKAGASGYLLKKTPSSELIESIKDLYNGGSPMSGIIARKVVQAFQTENNIKSNQTNLSKRENEILTYLAKGYRYKEIADKLFISIETVRTHIRNIYEKLQVRSRTEALLKIQNK